MKALGFLKGYDFMFYISLLWLGFPIYYSITGVYPIRNLYLTFIMVFCYLACLFVKKDLYINIMWVYIALYIVYISYYSPFNVMILMYMSSVLNYKYQEIKFLTFKSIIFYLTGCIIFIYYLYFVNRGEYFSLLVFIILSVCYFMHMATRAAVIGEKVKLERIKQNEYINNLLAENERNRIGRDLHDTLGHVFVMLSLKADLIEKLLEKNKIEEAKKEAIELSSISRLSMKQVREMIATLKHRSLLDELETSKETLALANINFSIANDFELDSLSPNIQNTLSMVLRETVNNILKHSKAEHVALNFYYEGNSVVFKVADDGKGFDNLDGTELKSIKDRLLLLKGSVDITSIKNPTTIKITIPVDIN